ncbi:hypothetical protein DCCM_3927 [Desulfocucumis palustris]|uniref:Uncharacterized protein n=1 Tax=Desulfocucumis palustris TaxID=1898651 RepID=A0A2L2XEN4_9FIRM|nr:DUF6208 family protein [Desulfocucumis palustris]GBF34807.1 hypothetical protein DCCM_3927 [Desulfocucumis palustris]
MRRIVNWFSIPFQIVISACSYGFVYVMRWVLRKINKEGGIMLLGKHESLSWQGWSKSQTRTWGLPYVMIVAPRWNPHSVQHHVGPLEVSGEILIHVETARKSAKQWIISFYRHGREVSTLSSMKCTNHDSWQSVMLTPGTYAIFLRYYNWDKNGECPAVKIDNKLQIPPCPIEPEIESYEKFMSDLKHRGNGFYCFLHYYVLKTLQWHKHLPGKFVRKAYLPFGNAGTIFYYGLLDKGEVLQIDYPQSLSEKASVYLVVLDTCGFPVFWLMLAKTRFVSDEMPRNGTYLIRIIYNKFKDYHAAVRNIEYCNFHVKEGKYRILSIKDNVG